MRKNKTLKELYKNQKKLHNQEVKTKIEATYSPKSYAYKLNRYRELKRLKWWSWLLIFGIFGLGVGLSFLVGYFTINSTKAPNWQGTGWFAIPYTICLVIGYLILGYVRNKQAIAFFNDRRRRYQKTLEDQEAKIQLVKKILLLSFLPMAIFAIIVTIVF